MNRGKRASPCQVFRKSSMAVARLYLARDVVECPECGEPEPFLGLFLRLGRGPAVRLWRLEWVTHAPGGFAKWVSKFCGFWRRAGEYYVNHCSSCGTPLADSLGFRSDGGPAADGWLCDAGIDVAVSVSPKTLAVSGFSPGAVALPDGHGWWEEALRLTSRDFRRLFREVPRFLGEGGEGLRLVLMPSAPPHRWRLVERVERGRRPAVDESFFAFPRAKEAARVRFGVLSASWRADAGR